MRNVELTWEGFRGFKRPTVLTLPNITLLIGRNNVGKTSAYAPLLILRQTLGARNPETALLSRGPLIDAGAFRDYVSDHNCNKSLTLTIGLDGGQWKPLRSVYDQELGQVGALQLEFSTVDGHNAFLTRQRILDREKKPIVTRWRDQPNEAFEVKSRLLPSRGQVGRPPKELTALRNALRQEQPEGFLISGMGGLILPQGVRRDKDRWAKVQDWYNSAFTLYELHRFTNSAIEEFLHGISYVGPLRSLPYRTYRLAPEPPTEVGGSGEFAPEVLLRLHKEGSAHVVYEWLGKLGYQDLDFVELNDEYFQVHVRTKGSTSVNIADSGVGLSQALPLLVQGAQADEGDTIIAQQPEIHLNPAQQSILTDFFIERAGRGTRVIIETHSEHVLLRLRRRIAEGLVSRSDVAIYFVDNVDGQTILKDVNLGEAGEIARDDWPRGFFEGQLEDAFALAVAQSNRRDGL